jgi:hypothetical protein
MLEVAQLFIGVERDYFRSRKAADDVTRLVRGMVVKKGHFFAKATIMAKCVWQNGRFIPHESVQMNFHLISPSLWRAMLKRHSIFDHNNPK